MKKQQNGYAVDRCANDRFDPFHAADDFMYHDLKFDLKRGNILGLDPEDTSTAIWTRFCHCVVTTLYRYECLYHRSHL